MNRPSDIVVSRFPSDIDWTLSEYSIQGIKSGVGVEDEYRAVKVHGETRIPNGIYKIGFLPSPKFGPKYFMDAEGNLSKEKTPRFSTPHLLLTVLNVPNFSHVLWHWGNTDDDTDACYVVGEYFGLIETKNGPQQGVRDSRINYVKNYPKIYQLYKKNKAAGLDTFVEYRDRAA